VRWDCQRHRYRCKVQTANQLKIAVLFIHEIFQKLGYNTNKKQPSLTDHVSGQDGSATAVGLMNANVIHHFVVLCCRLIQFHSIDFLPALYGARRSRHAMRTAYCITGPWNLVLGMGSLEVIGNATTLWAGMVVFTCGNFVSISYSLRDNIATFIQNHNVSSSRMTSVVHAYVYVLY